jgi:SAM-dependent MidA family methyltransferase
MGSSSPATSAPTPEFLRLFRTHAEPDGTLSFARFMDLALYAPEIGYYRRSRQRVGYGRGTDFFTASTSGPVFGELVAAACSKLLDEHGRAPAEHTFVEIGAEAPGGVLRGVSHPFAAVRTLQVGEPLTLSGRCIVFSNELFDAQPCTRTVFRGGRWHEVFVEEHAGLLREVERPVTAPMTPMDAPDGYRFDRPLAAKALAETLARQDWTGLFVAFDYGKTLHQLLSETPTGTARAYHQHRQSNDLLARPGEQDLTCHICWDWLEAALVENGFATPKLETQEAFLVRHAGGYIAQASATDAAHLTQRKLALMQLLHPSHLGQKFQVLHAFR